MRKKIVDGKVLYLSDILTGLSGHLWGNESYEPEFMWMLREESVGKLALDIGANIGYSTINLCNNMKSVIAIEPDERSRTVLKKNIELYKLKKRVKIYDFAMSDKNEIKTFYLSKHPNLSSFVKNKKYWNRKIEIKTRTIDNLDVLPNFIKMDIEGYEVEVLNGGMESLSKTKNCKILLEVHPERYNDKRNFSDTLKEFIRMGYKIKYVVSSGYSPYYLFEKYKVFKSFECGKFVRCIYKYIDTEDAICFSTSLFDKKNKDGIENVKIVRSIMLEK